MTVRAIAGLAGFNILLTVLGSGILAALRRGTTRKELLRLAGVSYLLGVAALMVALTLLLVLGIPVNLLSTVLAGAVLFAATSLLRRRRRTPSGPRRPEPRAWALVSVWSAPLLGLLAVCLEAVFRKGRLQGLIEFDGWDSWGPRTEALYHFGHLDPHFLSGLPGGSYPPGLPALLATGLHAIGSADVVTLHVQYWFLGVGFVAALVGLLSQRVAPLLLLPFVLTIFVMPDIRSRSVDMYGDLPLGFLVATAALLIALWLEERGEWQLPAASLLLAGAALTKREGVILAGCVVVAGLAASSDRVRKDWPRLLAVLVAAGAATLVWQIWLWAEALPGNGPSGGLHFLTDGRRGWDSFKVVEKNLFTFDLWLLSLTLAIAAVGLCLLVRIWRPAVYLAALITASLLGCTLILWSDANLQLTDINVVSRLVGTVALAVVALAPLVLQLAWDAEERPGRTGAAAGMSAWRVAVAWGLVAAAAIAYPATLLAEGGARFPNASDCMHAPSGRGSVLVVFGHERSYPDALLLQSRAVAAGAGPVRSVQDGCGRVRVYVAATSMAEGEQVVQRVRAAGLSAKLETGPST
jgi:hypothetical protein